MNERTTRIEQYNAFVPGVEPAQIVRRHEGQASVLRVLESACLNKIKATIFGPDQESEVGTFEVVESGKLFLRLESIDAVRTHSLCTVQFTFDKHQAFFVTIVLGQEIDESSNDFLVQVKIPSRIDEVEARWNRRIKITDPQAIKVMLSGADECRLQGRLIDIGRGGADIEVTGDTPFRVGECLELSITHKDQTLKMVAELRWKQGKRHGLSFTYRQSSGEFFIPEMLESLLRSLSSV